MVGLLSFGLGLGGVWLFRGGRPGLEHPPHLLELIVILVLDVHDEGDKAGLLVEARSGTRGLQ